MELSGLLRPRVTSPRARTRILTFRLRTNSMHSRTMLRSIPSTGDSSETKTISFTSTIQNSHMIWQMTIGCHSRRNSNFQGSRLSFLLSYLFGISQSIYLSGKPILLTFIANKDIIYLPQR